MLDAKKTEFLGICKYRHVFFLIDELNLTNDNGEFNTVTNPYIYYKLIYLNTVRVI